MSAADSTDVICSHFHADHVGWLFDTSARPVFPRAAIWFGSADWRQFVAGTGDMHTHIELVTALIVAGGPALTEEELTEHPVTNLGMDQGIVRGDYEAASGLRRLPNLEPAD